MKSMLKTCAALAATSVLLVACGGGNDDDPTPSNEPGVLTVSGASVGGLNGVYGNGSINLTDVDKRNPVGSVPELCAFNFDGLGKVGSPALAFGDIRYRPDATSLHQAFITFDGKEVGTMTSVSGSLGLGMVRREIEPGATVEVGGVEATVVAIPG